MTILGQKITTKGLEAWRYNCLKACYELEYPLTEEDLQFILNKSNGENAVTARMISIRNRL